jgi:hypothetical protein
MVVTGTDIQGKAAKRRSKRTHPKPPLPDPPVVSQDTKDRLYAEARRHPLFEGMEVAAIQVYIDERLPLFLAEQPWWYGHTSGPGGADTRYLASRQQYQARREKEHSARKVPVAKGPIAPVLVTNMPEEGGGTVVISSSEEQPHLIAA